MCCNNRRGCCLACTWIPAHCTSRWGDALWLPQHPKLWALQLGFWALLSLGGILRGPSGGMGCISLLCLHTPGMHANMHAVYWIHHNPELHAAHICSHSSPRRKLGSHDSQPESCMQLCPQNIHATPTPIMPVTPDQTQINREFNAQITMTPTHALSSFQNLE